MSTTPANGSGLINATGMLHFSFTVSDVMRSMRFYSRILGMEVLYSHASGQLNPIREEQQSYVAGVTGYPDAHLKIALLRMGNTLLELIEYLQPRGDAIAPGTNRPGSPHLAITVADLDHAWQVLQSQKDEWNLSFASESPVVVDKGQNVGGKAIYFRDPDGITIELVELNHHWARA
jgi:catechol 2,3-dioxygenase-like lactoylglutathione lyase family enzyme